MNETVRMKLDGFFSHRRFWRQVSDEADLFAGTSDHDGLVVESGHRGLLADVDVGADDGEGDVLQVGHVPADPVVKLVVSRRLRNVFVGSLLMLRLIHDLSTNYGLNYFLGYQLVWTSH